MNPIIIIDPLGLLGILPPNPNLNTTICKNGDFAFQLGSVHECWEECARKHEEKHVEDLKIIAPLLCKNKADYSVVSLKRSEKPALEGSACKIERECVEKKLECMPENDPCYGELNNRIKTINAYMASGYSDAFGK
jgi:hypothetical protein